MTSCEEHGCDEFFCRQLHDPVWVAEEELLRKELGDKADDPLARMEWDVNRSKQLMAEED